jgi:hypothetical protein
MTEIAARPAMSSDTAFLALAMQQADRGHTGIGSWDVMFPGLEDDRLHILTRLASAPQRSYSSETPTAWNSRSAPRSDPEHSSRVSPNDDDRPPQCAGYATGADG